MKRVFSVALIVIMLISMLGIISLASKKDARRNNAKEEFTTFLMEESSTVLKPVENKTTAVPKPVEEKTTVAPGWETTKWNIDENGTLTISGKGKMSDYSPFNNNASIKKVFVENGITTLNLSLFSDCDNISEFIIADSVTHINSGYREIPWYENQPDGMVYIGNIAYRWKGDIPEEGEIRIKDGTKIIGSRLFSVNGLNPAPKENDSRNVSVIVPDSVTTIEEEAFYSCSWLKEITIPKSITSIEKKAFEYCDDLYMRCEKNSAAQKYAEKENIPYGLINGTKADNTISGMAGKIKWSIDRLNRVLTVDCTGVMPDFGTVGAPWKDYIPYIETVVLSEGLTNISDNAFSGCVYLKSIKIPETVTSIGSFAFSRCRSLSEIRIPDGVTAIQAGTFDRCANLQVITLSGSIQRIGWSAFYDCQSLKSITVYDPDCEIDNDNNVFPYTAVLYGYPGSTIQSYADQYGLLFKEIGSDSLLPGDVSGDGDVTAEDARLALRAAVGLETYAAGSPEFLAADATKDGAITAEDARLILRAAVGLETLT